MGDVGHGQREVCVPLGHSSLYFNISLLQQFTEPRTSVLLNSRNYQKVTINLHYGDRLSYTQAEELNLATVYRSQQLYTAEQWLNCKKKTEVGNTIPFHFLLFLHLFPSPPLSRGGSLKTSYGV